MRYGWLLLALCLGAANVAAQTMPIDVEIGYRWTDVSGNENMYRTQINEREGLLIRALTLATADLRLDLSDVGVGPASSLRFDTRRDGLYQFQLRYRKADAFSALPNFAFGQHTFDRTRDVVDADLQIVRWSKIKPFIGYTWNRLDGPGTTTWNVGQDEFVMSQDLRDTDRELRIGAAFELGPVSGQLTQGWRTFRGRETLTLAPGANNGNNPGPVVGRPINASALTRDERTDVDTPFTSLFLAGQATSKIRLTGNFARFTAEGDTDGADAATGSLASFGIGRFFSGLTETSSSRAENDAWRGVARADITFTDHVDLTAGYRREHRELDGSALIRTLYLQSVTFGGADPRDLEVILRAENALERDEDVIDAAITVRPVTPLALRFGLSESNMDVTVTPDLSEIVVDGAQGGTFDRRVRTLLLDGSYSAAGFTLGASLQRDTADAPILRNDFVDRDRFRLRAAWKAPRFVRIGFVADQTQQSNDRADIDYDATVRQYTGDVLVTPIEPLSFRVSASRFRADSNILIRRPENFAIEESIHLERGESVEGGLTFSWSRLSFDGDLAHFENEGSLPFELDRSRARLTVQLRDAFGLGAEWARDEYSESSFAISDYEATRYSVFLRMRR